MAEIGDIDEIGVALTVVGVFQGVIFGLQGESEVGRQVDLHRQGDAAFDCAIAKAGGRGRDLDKGHESHGENAAVIADQIYLDLDDRVAESMAVGDERAGLITVRRRVQIAVELELEIDRTREA